MIEWLKSSIWGIILLGAVGSILAAGILKVTAGLIRRFVRPAITSIVGRWLIMMRAPHYVREFLRTSTDLRQLVVTCTVLTCGFLFVAISFALGIVILSLGACLLQLSPHSAAGKLMAFGGTFCSGLALLAQLDLLSDLKKLYLIYMGQAEVEAAEHAREEYDKAHRA